MTAPSLIAPADQITVNHRTNLINPDAIYNLYTGCFRPQLVRIALQLDLFSVLAAQPASAATAAQACGCDPQGMRYLLDYFTSLAMLEQQEGLYRLTPAAAAFLVRGQQSYAGDLILAWTGNVIWESVLQALRSGQPTLFEEYHAQDAWLESYSSTRPAQSREMWAAAGVRPQGYARLELLDIACGCAIKSLALAQTASTVHVTCVDTPAVLSVTADLVERLQLGAQTTLWPADLTRADFGTARYQACLLGQITYYLTPQQNCDLLRRIYTALAPGGTLVIDAVRPGSRPDEWSSFVSVLLWANGGGAAHRLEDYAAWLTEAGFAGIRPLSERWLTATK